VRPIWIWRSLVAALLLISPVLAGSSGARSVPGPSTAAGEDRACLGGYVALTFDDGPDPVTTPKIAAELAANDDRATFFLIGARIEAHPDTVLLIRSAGMEVGNHTYDHPFLDEQDPAQIRRELTATNDLLAGLGGPAPRLFRPPYGRTDPRVRAVAQDLGMVEVLWSYDSDDYSEATGSEMVDKARHANDGDILLFHDGYQNTVEAIPKILDVFAQRGICTGRVAPTTIPKQAWRDYSGDDKAFYFATATRW
jgi:peptidoglycan/xylan/chitin deacetylase (PgdA/CDA1 family)